MKIYTTIITITLALFSVVTTFPQESQELELKKIKLDLGKGSLTSGYDISLLFSDESSVLQITGNHTRAYGVYSEDHGFIKPAISGGFFKNCPWIGPRVVLSPVSGVSFMFWYAVSAGLPDHPDTRLNALIRYNGIFVDIWKCTLSGAMNKFANDKVNYYPGIAFSDKLNSSWQYKIAVDYDINNKEPLFQFGLSHLIK